MTTLRNSYALVIGVANYPYLRPLPEAVLNDARDTAALLLSPSCGYPPANVKTILDAEANRQGILDGFDWLAQKCGASDTALIFISSHGGLIEEENSENQYLLPYDCRPESIKDKGVSSQEMTGLLRAIEARKMVVFFDFCFSGGAAELKAAGKDLPLKSVGFTPDAYEKLAEGAGRVIIASSRPNEPSRVLPGMSNSLFTHYLLEALKGGAYSRGDGLIRIFDVFHFLSDSVPTRADQHPCFKASDLENNFPISLYLGGTQMESKSKAPLSTRAINQRALREALVAYFSQDELEILCADVERDLAEDGHSLRVSLEMASGGGTKEKKVLDLIGYLERRGYLEYLAQSIRRIRPGIACQF